jgi:thymidine phosphorylase
MKVYDKNGYIHELDALAVGKIAMMVGAGRETKDDEIDQSVGVVLNKKYGQRVRNGETLATLHINDYSLKKDAAVSLRGAFIIKPTQPVENNLIYDTIN